MGIIFFLYVNLVQGRQVDIYLIQHFFHENLQQ